MMGAAGVKFPRNIGWSAINRTQAIRTCMVALLGIVLLTLLPQDAQTPRKAALCTPNRIVHLLHEKRPLYKASPTNIRFPAARFRLKLVMPCLHHWPELSLMPLKSGSNLKRALKISTVNPYRTLCTH